MIYPKKGDIILLSFNPPAGTEQIGKRPALVISTKSFNETTGFAFICPITNQSKDSPFEVEVSGSQKTTGVVLSDQLKSLDLKVRNFNIVDSVDSNTLENTIKHIGLIIDYS